MYWTNINSTLQLFKHKIRYFIELQHFWPIWKHPFSFKPMYRQDKGDFNRPHFYHLWITLTFPKSSGFVSPCLEFRLDRWLSLVYLIHIRGKINGFPHFSKNIMAKENVRAESLELEVASAIPLFVPTVATLLA